jgi:MFS family permease
LISDVSNPASRPTASSEAARWTAISVFALASAWNYLDRLTLSAAAPRIMTEFHLSKTDYGWLLSAFSFSYTFASPAVGWFLDRLGLETGILWAVALWSLAAALCGWTRNLGQLIGARVFLGIWESAGVPAAGKVNAIYLEPKNRAIGAAMTQVGLSIGSIGAPLLVGMMTGWRSPFFVCSALGFAWIPVWIAVRRKVRPYEEVPPQREPGAFRRLLGDRRLLMLMGANILWMGIYTLWSNWTMVYLVQSFGLTTEAASWYAWVPPVASTLGAFRRMDLEASHRQRNASGAGARDGHAGQRDRMPGDGARPAQFNTVVGDARDLRQLLLGNGGQCQSLHHSCRYLGRPERWYRHLGSGIRLWVIADRDLAGDRKPGRPFRIHACVLAGRAAAVCGLAVAPLMQQNGNTCAVKSRILNPPCHVAIRHHSTTSPNTRHQTRVVKPCRAANSGCSRPFRRPSHSHPRSTSDNPPLS